MNTVSKLALTLALSLSSASLALADDAHHASGSGQAAVDRTSTAEGEVKKVDKDAGKVTIKHGELVSLDMPAMTMVFRVKDPAMLDQVKAGDKIRFVAEKAGGQFTVTQVEVKK
jgi:Cu(I)/Ag(I) efflux system protein CusF